MAPPSRLRAITRQISSFSSLSSLRKSHLTPTSYTQTRCYTQHLHRPLQIYRSTSTDPYLNLSIEHHLLQRSHPDSTILFLYANRPSIVIGRNQNPWLEVNLHALRQGIPPSSSSPPSPPPQRPNQSQPPSTPPIPPIQQKNAPISLVRRRSGGGTVFHDAGNTNWSVICPPAAFDRDKHAEMVVRALRQRLGVRGARVNERHDIVMDVVDSEKGVQATFKVSGSAYKLTRTRSLHHGTCLLGLEGLGRVGALLRSPAEGYIKARGVESVRSAIRNVGVGGEEFADAVVEEFRVMYGDVGAEEVVVGEEEALAKEEVVKGLRELTSPEWIFGQTPQFTFSTHPTEDDPRERPGGIHAAPHGLNAHFTVRHGEIQSASVAGLEYRDMIDEPSQDEILSSALAKQRLHHIQDWRQTLQEASPVPVNVDGVGKWLNYMFGIQTLAENNGQSVAQTAVQTVSNTAVGEFLNRKD